jgi:hypothetical protein
MVWTNARSCLLVILFKWESFSEAIAQSFVFEWTEGCKLKYVLWSGSRLGLVMSHSSDYMNTPFLIARREVVKSWLQFILVDFTLSLRDISPEWIYPSWYYILLVFLVDSGSYTGSVTVGVGRAVTQAVSRWFPTAAARVGTRARSCGICGGQSGARDFDFLCQSSVHQLFHNHHHLLSWAGTIGQLVTAVPVGHSLTPLGIIIKNCGHFSDKAQPTTGMWERKKLREIEGNSRNFVHVVNHQFCKN